MPQAVRWDLSYLLGGSVQERADRCWGYRYDTIALHLVWSTCSAVQEKNSDAGGTTTENHSDYVG